MFSGYSFHEDTVGSARALTDRRDAMPLLPFSAKGIGVANRFYYQPRLNREWFIVYGLAVGGAPRGDPIEQFTGGFRQPDRGQGRGKLDFGCEIQDRFQFRLGLPFKDQLNQHPESDLFTVKVRMGLRNGG